MIVCNFCGITHDKSKFVSSSGIIRQPCHNCQDAHYKFRMLAKQDPITYHRRLRVKYVTQISHHRTSYEINGIGGF